MPSLNQSRKVLKVVIPGIEGGEAEVYDNLIVGDLEQLQEKTSKERIVFILKCLLKAWNLDEPVSEENIKKLDSEQYMAILKVTKFWQDAQKTVEEKQEEAFEKKTN